MYRRFHQAHAPGPKVTSGLCTVKVMSNEVGLRLLCCGMCFTYIHLFVATHHNIKTFKKNQNEARVFLYHCISEGTLSLENV